MFEQKSGDIEYSVKRDSSPVPVMPEVAKPKKGKESMLLNLSRPLTGNRLDNEEIMDLHRRLRAFYVTEQDRQFLNRMEQAEDDDFYDNIQWKPEEIQALTDRGQDPMIYNVLSASVDWITGTEKKTRSDFRILPRRKEEGKQAQRKTELMKYLSDASRSHFHKSRAFEDAIKVGIGWLEDGWDPAADGEPLYTRYENWRNVLYDSASQEMDLSDARYIFRHKWIDLDIAKAMFDKRKAVIERSVSSSSGLFSLDQMSDEVSDAHENALQDRVGEASGSRTDDLSGYDRQRVRIIEAWIRIPVMTDKLSGGAFSGEVYDEHSEAHQEAVASGTSTIIKRMVMRMHVAIFTAEGMLYFGRSPYRHNQFPLTPIWAYRRAKDGLPYGMIRRLKDIQRDVNKRAANALHILSTNKVVMDEGAVPDMDEFLEEVNRPDAVIIKKTGKELRFNVDREFSESHVNMMSRSISMVQQASGVTDELLGRRTNASSGIAIQRRQEQGSMATAKLFDHNTFAQQVRGEKVLANMEQFMSEKKAFRITNKQGVPEYVEVNDGLADNDIIRTKADYIIDEEDMRSTMRQAAADQLMQMIPQLSPQVATVMLDLLIEMTDLPYADEIAKRIRSVTGMPDPNEDPDNLSPEDQEKKAAAAQQAQFQQEVAQAELRDKVASAALKEAQAAVLGKKAILDTVAAQEKALSAASNAIEKPAAVTMADHILHESGYDSRSTMEEQAEAAALQQQQEQQQPVMQPQEGNEAAGMEMLAQQPQAPAGEM